MNLSDLIDITDIIDMMLSPRFYIALIASIGIGILLYFVLGGGTPGIVGLLASALVGSIVGFVWDRRHEGPR